MRLIRRLVSGSRYLFVVAVVSTFILSVMTFFQGTALTVKLVIKTPERFADLAAAKQAIVEAIQIVDLFLLATVFYIIALGLYALFIDDELHMPSWLEFHSFNDVKADLIGVLIVVLGVFFLSKVIVWKEGYDLLFFGGAIALIILALTYFLSLKKEKP
ncbi:MAG TPA: YqhA family protein [Anaerolineae bacterium]|nr:YqhA family protein [Anaerolineae bacterium]